MKRFLFLSRVFSSSFFASATEFDEDFDMEELAFLSVETITT